MRSITRFFAPAWILLWFGAAILTEWLVDSANFEPTLSRGLLPPSPGHWLGFDAFGRDVLLVTLHASAFSAMFCLISMAIVCIAAVILGTLIAILPDRPRFLCLRTLDLFLGFPSLLLALSWAAVRGPGWETLTVSLILGALPGFIRLIYVRTRELMVEPYIQAAISLGATPGHLIARHLAPALGSIVALKAPFLLASAFLAEATLSFLGVGAPIGHETWGSLLADGKDYLFEAPHLALGAGIPLVLTILAFQMIVSDKS